MLTASRIISTSSREIEPFALRRHALLRLVIPAFSLPAGLTGNARLTELSHAPWLPQHRHHTSFIHMCQMRGDRVLTASADDTLRIFGLPPRTGPGKELQAFAWDTCIGQMLGPSAAVTCARFLDDSRVLRRAWPLRAPAYFCAAPALLSKERPQRSACADQPRSHAVRSPQACRHAQTTRERGERSF